MAEGQQYEVLAQNLDDVEIRSYDPTIWSPEEFVGSDEDKYEIQEPASYEVAEDIISNVVDAQGEAIDTETEFYNGPLVRMKNHQVSGGKLLLDIQNTNYFSHVGTRNNPELEKGERADPLSVGAHLQTSDGYIVLGEKSGMVEIGEGEYQLPGAGFIENPKLQYERSLNAEPSSPIHRELEEEVNLDTTQLTGPEPAALIGAVYRQPMLVYKTDTVLDSEKVAEQWWEIPEAEREFSELVFIDEPEELLDGEVMKTGTERGSDLEFSKFTGSLRPHAEGALEALNHSR